MTTNPGIDPALLDVAYEVGGMSTKQQTVTVALQEFIARRNRAKIVDLFGTIEWDEDFDYKAARQARDAKTP